MNITVHYKNGNSWCENIHYMHCKDGFIYMTIQRQLQAVVEIPTKIPMTSIDGYDIYPDTLENMRQGSSLQMERGWGHEHHPSVSKQELYRGQQGRGKKDWP